MELNIDTGVEEFRVNGRGVLRFNPADPNLYHRFFAAGAELDSYDAALTKALAQELGPSGIRVNAVAPGVIRTDMCASVAPEVMEELRQQTPTGTLGTPEDAAQAIAYLADAPFVTGQVLAVNGGFVIT